MSRGYLIHAYNNKEIDYGLMALCCALLLKKNLQENKTALVTTSDTVGWLMQSHPKNLLDYAFDQVIITDIDRNVPDRNFHDTQYTTYSLPYYNTNRVNSCELSPFDETVLIDADFLVLDNSLDNVWNSSEDLLVNKSIIDLNHVENLGGFDKRFNDMSIPLYWATVMYFRKTDRVKSLFELMDFIKQNYNYYQQLYGFKSNSYFRNDYAISIAIHMLNSQVEGDAVKNLPVANLLVATEYDDMIDFQDGTAAFVSERQQGDFKFHKISTNVHVMNKWSIGRMAKRIVNYATNK
jgi:hypothetical protein